MINGTKRWVGTVQKWIHHVGCGTISNLFLFLLLDFPSCEIHADFLLVLQKSAPQPQDAFALLICCCWHKDIRAVERKTTGELCPAPLKN